MSNPFIFVIHEDDDGVVINYRTSRTGLCSYLYG